MLENCDQTLGSGGLSVSKIVVVDDDVTITELMKLLMTMEGHQPTTVNDSTKAMQEAQHLACQIIRIIRGK